MRKFGWTKQQVEFACLLLQKDYPSPELMIEDIGSIFRQKNPDGKSTISQFLTELGNQIDCAHTKGGLCLDSLMILPTACVLDRDSQCQYKEEPYYSSLSVHCSTFS
ncbi:hypothetical protein G4B88_002670, partial [Cannabis sativa]